MQSVSDRLHSKSGRGRPRTNGIIKCNGRYEDRLCLECRVVVVTDVSRWQRHES
jgi:hypothetical protein